MNIQNQFRILFSVVFILGTIVCKAQKDSLMINNFIYSKTHIGFSLNPNMAFLGKAKLISGTQNLTTSNMFGFEGGVDFIFNPEQNIGINTGLHVGAVPFDWGYNLNQTYDSIFGTHVQNYNQGFGLFSRDYFGYLNIPLQLEWRTPIDNHTYFTLAGGLNLQSNFSSLGGIGFSLQSSSQDTSLEFLSISFPNSKNQFQANFAFGAGMNFVLKNQNLLFLNATANVAGRNFISGNFTFYNTTGVESTGTYTKAGTNVGLEFGYRFTKAKKAARMVSLPAYMYAKNRNQNTKIISNDLDYIFKRNQVEVNIGPQFNLKPMSTATLGEMIEMKGDRAPYLRIDYSLNKNINWAFKTGFTLGSIAYRYSNVYSFDSSLLQSNPHDFGFEFGTIGLTEYIEYRYPIKRNILIYGDAGFNLSMLVDGEGEIYSSYKIGSYYPTDYIRTKTTGNVLFGANFGLGLLFACRNYNMWRIGANYNHSFSSPITGQYDFNDAYPYHQTGSIKKTGSYIAATIGYVYSFAPSPYAIAKHRLKIATDTRVRKPKITNSDLNSIYTKNQIAITTELNFMMKPKVEVYHGNSPELYTYPKPGLHAEYIFNFNKNWGIKTGLNVTGYSYDTYSRTSNYADITRYNYDSYNILTTFGCAVNVEYRKPINRCDLWYVDVGFNFKKYYNYSESYYVVTDSTSSSSINTLINSNSLNAGAEFSTGILLTAKNYNQWKIGVTYNLLFVPLLQQDYLFSGFTAQQTNAGTITTSGNYLGISAGYVFSFKKK